VASGQITFGSQVYFPYVTQIKIHTYSKNGTIQNAWVNQWQIGSKLLISNSAGDVAMFTITSAPDLNGAIYTVGVVNFNTWDAARALELSFGFDGTTNFNEDVSIIYLPVPRTHVTKYTTYTDNSWTCPAGVTQIKLTLIGAGGASGDASAIGQNTTASFTSAADTAGATTFTVGETAYTALGGRKGLNHIVTADTLAVEGDFDLWISGSSSSSGTEVDDIRYPGCGGGPAVCSATSQRNFIMGGFNDRLVSYIRILARSLRGQDGLTEVFQVAVTPGTTYTFSIGKGAGFVANSNVTDTYMGSNGAVIIEYVV
jgi:hypothetical protein